MTPQGETTDILSKMRLGASYSFPIKCRGFEFFARPLSVSEQNQVVTEAQSKIDSMSAMAKNVFSEATLLAQCYLMYASRPIDKPTTITDVNEYLLNKATPEELQYMYKQYCAIVEKCNPGLELVSGEEIQILVDALKKKKKEMVLALTELSFKDLVSICNHLLTQNESPTDS